MSDINSKTSTHWFLNEIKEQVMSKQQSEHCQNSNNRESCIFSCNTSFDMLNSTADYFENTIMSILTDKSRIYYDNDTWEIYFLPDSSNLVESKEDSIVKEDQIYSQEPLQKPSTENTLKILKPVLISSKTKNNSFIISNSEPVEKVRARSSTFQEQTIIITCSPYVNQTQYDHLNGIHNRDNFKFFPEPEVALMFGKKSGDNSKIEINLKNVIAQLLDSRMKRPKSPNVYNNIGNLLRIHGESREAVECFRSALKLSPHNPDVLLNLARVLYNQNFLEDAIYLTRHSLETQPRNRNPWLQHFTLGEFLRSTGHKQEAQYHFIQSLEFNPGFAPAKDYLKEFSQKSNAINIVYSFCISVFLLSIVLYIAFLNLEFYNADINENQKSHRHFNRGMAMKALKTFNTKSRNRRIS